MYYLNNQNYDERKMRNDNFFFLVFYYKYKIKLFIKVNICFVRKNI